MMSKFGRQSINFLTKVNSNSIASLEIIDSSNIKAKTPIKNIWTRYNLEEEIEELPPTTYLKDLALAFLESPLITAFFEGFTRLQAFQGLDGEKFSIKPNQELKEKMKLENKK